MSTHYTEQELIDARASLAAVPFFDLLALPGYELTNLYYTMQSGIQRNYAVPIDSAETQAVKKVERDAYYAQQCRVTKAMKKQAGI